MIGVTENLALISDLLHKSAREAGRDPAGVRLLAVSKKQPLEKIREAAAAGQRDFGENFVQEGVEKVRTLSDLDLTWHFIGHLQSNKTRVVAEYFDWVHTIDKLKTARRLNDQRPPGRPPLNICIQVNVDDEVSKSGVSPAALPELAHACEDLQNLILSLRAEMDLTSVIITHAIEEAAILGTRILVLSQYYSDDRGDGVQRGSRIVADHHLPAIASATLVKKDPQFLALIDFMMAPGPE